VNVRKPDDPATGPEMSCRIGSREDGVLLFCQLTPSSSKTSVDELPRRQLRRTVNVSKPDDPVTGPEMSCRIGSREDGVLLFCQLTPSSSKTAVDELPRRQLRRTVNVSKPDDPVTGPEMSCRIGSREDGVLLFCQLIPSSSKISVDELPRRQLRRTVNVRKPDDPVTGPEMSCRIGSREDGVLLFCQLTPSSSKTAVDELPRRQLRRSVNASMLIVTEHCPVGVRTKTWTVFTA